MSTSKITINGQTYDSPEAMPPDVRRLYDEAMRTVAGGPSGGSTQVVTGRIGEHAGASIVVNRTVTVNHRTYGSLDELPPEARQQLENALESAQVRPRASVHLSLNMEGPQLRTLDDAGKSRTPVPLPIEPSSTESTIRSLPVSLAILVGIALVLWFLMGR
jgi:hypothetical protein